MDILSADSMLVYRGMDIGTAKPTTAERAGLVYYGIDLVGPDRPCSAGLYLQAAEAAIRSAAEHGRDLLVVGGTGLYIELLLHGLDGGETSSPPPEIRERYQALLASGGLAALHAEAECRSPGVLSCLADPENPRRVQRVLERLDMGLDPVPTREPGSQSREAATVVLTMEPEILAQRIVDRIETMFDAGLLEEVRRLLCDYPEWSSTAAAAIGYAEARAVLSGELSMQEAKERIAIRTRQLAKRQRTWFRHHLQQAAWIEGPHASIDIPHIADAVERAWFSATS